MNSNDASYQPSTTNPQCKVCTSPDRFEIEVALAQGSHRRQLLAGSRATASRSAARTSTRITTSIWR